MSRTLTAEQVREAVESNSWAETGSIREFNDSSWQAIADELNSQAERTCKNPCIAGFMCSECGASCGGFPLIGAADVPWSYCPNCGAKVVDE